MPRVALLFFRGMNPFSEVMLVEGPAAALKSGPFLLLWFYNLLTHGPLIVFFSSYKVRCVVVNCGFVQLAAG